MLTVSQEIVRWDLNQTESLVLEVYIFYTKLLHIWSSLQHSAHLRRVEKWWGSREVYNTV